MLTVAHRDGREPTPSMAQQAGVSLFVTASDEGKAGYDPGERHTWNRGQRSRFGAVPQQYPQPLHGCPWRGFVRVTDSRAWHCRGDLANERTEPRAEPPSWPERVPLLGVGAGLPQCRRPLSLLDPFYHGPPVGVSQWAACARNIRRSTRNNVLPAPRSLNCCWETARTAGEGSMWWRRRLATRSTPRYCSTPRQPTKANRMCQPFWLVREDDTPVGRRHTHLFGPFEIGNHGSEVACV